MKIVFEMNLAALRVSVLLSLGDFHRWQRKYAVWKYAAMWLLQSADSEHGQTLAQKQMTQDRCTASIWSTPGIPSRLVFTLFIVAGLWRKNKEDAEDVSVFICFKSWAILLQIHKKQNFFLFFFLALALLQHRPETHTDGDISCNPLWAYLDLSGSCILHIEGIKSSSQAVA